MPRVVTAGVPMRMPLVTNGDCVSFGTVFLFTVIAARSSAFSADLAGEALVAQVDEHQVVVGAAGDDLEAARRRAPSASACAFATTCLRILLERRVAAPP